MTETGKEGLEIVQPDPQEAPQRDAELPETREEPPDSATSGTPTSKMGIAPSGSVFEPKVVPGKGRPRKDGMPVGSVAPGKVDQLPRPKFTVFKSDATNGSQRTKAFFNWWNELPKWARERVICYVYRDWPVLVTLPEDSNDFAYIDKIAGEDPLQDDIDLLHRYGIGRYKLMFNEQPGANLCTAYVYNLGNDLKSYPPTDRRISDIAQVDASHPDNKSYIEFLKMRGQWTKEEDMATTTVVERVLDQNRELVQSAISAAKTQPERPAKDSTSVPLETAMRMGMEVVADAAKRSNEMLQSAVEQAKQISAPQSPQQQNQQPQVDPMQLAIQLVSLIQQGKSEGNKEVEMLRAQLAQLQQDQLRMMSEQLKTLTERLTTNTSPAASNPFSSIQEGMKAMREMKSVVDEISGGGDKGGVVEETIQNVGPKWLSQYAPLIQQGFSLFDSFLRYRAASSGVPMPMQQPNPMPPMQMGPQPVMPVMPHPQAAPALPPGFPPELANLLMRISISLQNHLLDLNATGTMFADWFIGGEGEQTYQEICSFGPDQVIQALQTFPVTAQILAQVQPERARSFVEEFLKPNWEEGEEGEGEEGQSAPSGDANPGTPAAS